MHPNLSPNPPADGEWIRTEGGSMFPFLPPGSLVALEWFGASGTDGPRVGDLVLCRAPDGAWIFHRVVGLENTGRWLVKGDASLLLETFSRGEIWGRAKAIRASGDCPARAFHTNFIDVTIARLSFWTAQARGWRQTLLRRATLAIGWARPW